MRWTDPLFLEFLGNPLVNWGVAGAIFLGTLTVLPILKGYITGKRRRWTDVSLPTALDLTLLLISRTNRLFLWSAALYLSTRVLTFSPGAHRVLTAIIVIAFWLQVGIWGVAGVRFALDKRQSRQAPHDSAAASSVTIIMFVANILVWAIVALLALGNLGINITALVAGLGIGGIAIALAVQTVLGDLLASLSIAFDKPFRIGDTLGVDDYTGTVESIGIKSTRLRSVSGEQLIISNADLLKSRVRNLGRMPEQRSLVQLNMDYENSKEKLDQIAPIAEHAVKSQPNTSFKYCVFKNFGPTALEFELNYYVKEPQGLAYVNTVDAVNRAIQRELAAQQIRFAYPSRQPYQALREAKPPTNPPTSPPASPPTGPPAA